MGYEAYTEDEYRKIIEKELQTYTGLKMVAKMIECTQGAFKEIPKGWLLSPLSVALHEYNKRILELRDRKQKIKKAEKEREIHSAKTKNNLYLCDPQLG